MSNAQVAPWRYVHSVENARRGCDDFHPLMERFGRDLACSRNGTSVSWALDGQTAMVFSRTDGSVGVTFSDRPTLDQRRSVSVAAAYRPLGNDYPLANRGVSRMVEDMLAFFAGVREPRFAFVGIEDRID